MEEIVAVAQKLILIIINWVDQASIDSAHIYLINGFILYFVLHAFRMLAILLLNKRLAFKSHSWNSAGTGGTRILILGDSTAVGTGAMRAEDSIAGRLAHDFPNAEIKNRGKNGGLISDVTKQIDFVRNETFDLIIITVGGNDVWSLTSLRSITKNLNYIFAAAKAMSQGRVFFLLYNNIGDAPIFPGFIRYFLKRRCNQIQSRITQCAMQQKIALINLFTEDINNPFLKSPKKLFAKDGIHPSSEGYSLWYKRMWREMVAMGFHFGN